MKNDSWTWFEGHQFFWFLDVDYEGNNVWCAKIYAWQIDSNKDASLYPFGKRLIRFYYERNFLYIYTLLIAPPSIQSIPSVLPSPILQDSKLNSQSIFQTKLIII